MFALKNFVKRFYLLFAQGSLIRLNPFMLILGILIQKTVQFPDRMLNYLEITPTALSFKNSVFINWGPLPTSAFRKKTFNTYVQRHF